MTTSIAATPDYAAIPGCWNAYVAAGTTEAEQVSRYFQAPEAFRPGAWAHLQTVRALRERAKSLKVRREIEGAQ